MLQQNYSYRVVIL